MWSRKLSTSMGFDQQDFVKAFISALNDESVINKLDSVICGHLNVDIGNLSEAQKKSPERFRRIQRYEFTVTKGGC